MICGACLSGVEVSLETQNELLDLAAQHLGNISAEEALEPVEVLRGLHNSVIHFKSMLAIIASLAHYWHTILALPCFKISHLISNWVVSCLVEEFCFTLECCPLKE